MDKIIWTEDGQYHSEKKFNGMKKLKRKFRNFGVWIKNNEKEILMFTPLIVGGIPVITKTITGVTKHANLRKEQKIKELYCYDPSLGHYWKLNRKLSNSDWVKIDRRRQAGERMSDILNDMKVL